MLYVNFLLLIFDENVENFCKIATGIAKKIS